MSDNSQEILGILASFNEEVKQLRQLDENSEPSKEIYSKIERVLSDEGVLSKGDIDFTLNKIKGMVAAGEEKNVEAYKEEAAQILSESHETLEELNNLEEKGLQSDIRTALKSAETLGQNLNKYAKFEKVDDVPSSSSKTPDVNKSDVGREF